MNRMTALTVGALSLALLVALSCDGGSGGSDNGDGGSTVRHTSILLKVLSGGAVPEAKLIQQDLDGPSKFELAGLSVVSILDDVAIEIVNVVENLGDIEITIRVTNNAAVPFDRVWLALKSLTDEVELLRDGADGHIGNGRYYFLYNLDPGESETATIVFHCSAGVTEFQALLDVFSVGERISFQYFTTEGVPVIKTMAYNGTDIFQITSDAEGEYAMVGVPSQDGGWVAFAKGFPTESEIGLARTDGGGVEQLTCFNDGPLTPWSFTRDSKGIYLRFYSNTAGISRNYLLDIETARQDCSSTDSLTLVTEDMPDIRGDAAPLAAPDGTVLFFGREVDKKVPPPYPEGIPNSTCCPDWAFGSESSFIYTDFYVVPTDPATGLPNGPEQLFWEDSIELGIPSVMPDGSGLLTRAGGCAGYEYVCNASCNWKLNCKKSIPDGLYLYKLPDNWAELPYNFIDNPEGYTYFPGFIYTGYPADHPYWCWESDRVVYTDKNHDIFDCDPYNCKNDKNEIYGAAQFLATPRCTGAVGDP